MLYYLYNNNRKEVEALNNNPYTVVHKSISIFTMKNFYVYICVYTTHRKPQ